MKKQVNFKQGLRTLDSTKVWRVAGFSSLGVLGVMGALALSPISSKGADALDNTTRSAATRLTVDASAMISVSLDDGIEMDVTPNAAGQFVSKAVNLGVRTNNREGYDLSMRTANGETTLKSATAGTNEKAIASVASATTGTSMAANTWGYTLVDKDTTVSADSTFNPIANASTSTHFGLPTGDEGLQEFQLGFGAKVSSSLPAGKYSNEVVVSVVASPEKITKLSDLVFMQDMTPEICANSETEVEKQLYDIRDGNKYYVSKLKDGNCWMTQNLALDLEAGHTLTSGDTDLGNNGTATSWLIPTDTETKIPTKVADDNTLARSWNLGEVVLNNPTGSQLCPMASGQTDQYNSMMGPDGKLTDCQYYTDVSSMTEGFSASATSSVSGNTYDGHYLVGNYYQWGAVTAESGTGTTAPAEGNTDKTQLVDAPNSICPKGWKLPTSGAYFKDSASYPYNRDDSFETLLSSYGYPTGDQQTGWTANGGYPYTPITGEGRTRLDYKPLSFVRSGYVYSGYGSLRTAGLNGDYWSSTAYPGSSTASCTLGFNTANVLPADHNDRVYGFSARCLAR